MAAELMTTGSQVRLIVAGVCSFLGAVIGGWLVARRVQGEQPEAFDVAGTKSVTASPIDPFPGFGPADRGELLERIGATFPGIYLTLISVIQRAALALLVAKTFEVGG